MLENDKIINNFNNLLSIINRLRDDETGCEWCKQQTSKSISKYCLEEANEVIEAIESGDNSRICDELGDLLFQVIFHSEIKKEENAFSINDVIMSINNKMIRRNPHVFDNKDNKKFTIDEIDKNWKKIKQKEKL